MHVFISYHHNDLDFAENVIHTLEKEGFTTWADDKLQAGEDWRTMIDLAIKNAFALIVIMTPSAKASEYVTYEWAFAWGVGVKVIPIMLELTPLHPRLEALQYLDFTNRKTRPWGRLIQEVRNASSIPLAHSVRIPLNAPPVIRNAVIALDSASFEERFSAIQTLVQMSSPDAQGILLEALKHPIPDVRGAAAEFLGQIGDASVVPALCELLHDAHGDVRARAAESLGQIGDASVTPALCEALHDDLYEVRAAAARSLGQIGDASVTPALCEVLHNTDARVQLAAVGALEQIGDASAKRALRDLLASLPSQPVQDALDAALGNKPSGDSLLRQGVMEALAKLERQS